VDWKRDWVRIRSGREIEEQYGADEGQLETVHTTFVYRASSATGWHIGSHHVAAEQTLKEPEMVHKTFHSQGWLEVVTLCIPAASMKMD
jgi:hypothetical protein